MSTKADFACLCEKFFGSWLKDQKNHTANSISTYLQAFCVFLPFICKRLRTTPSKLQFRQINAPLIESFLKHLESERGNSVRTRNARRAALRAFFNYCALERPQHSAQIQRILAIPRKKTDRPLVCHLTRPELEALLATVDQSTWIGRRNYTLLLLAGVTGLRNSELRALRQRDIEFGPCSWVKCYGKGRKSRLTPLENVAVAALKNWIEEQGHDPEKVLFPNSHENMLSADAVQYTVRKHAKAAAKICPSIAKKKVKPHALRHTTAMHLLEAGVDQATIAGWLGHESIESTQVYAEATLKMKEQALSKGGPINAKFKKFTPDSELLSFIAKLSA